MSHTRSTALSLTLALAALGAVGTAGTSAVGQEKKDPAKLSAYEKLSLLIDTKELTRPMPLKEYVYLLTKLCADQGVVLPILVDTRSFREADESQPNGPNDDEVSLPAIPGRVTVSEALRLAVAQIKNQNGTFIVQNGRIWILTEDNAMVAFRLAERVVAHFDRTPVTEVVKRLADLAGTTIMIDPRADEKARTPITVDLNGDCSIGAALVIIADMVGLRVVRMGNTPKRFRDRPAAAAADLSIVRLGATPVTRQPVARPNDSCPANLAGTNRCVYITTPANATALEKRIREDAAELEQRAAATEKRVHEAQAEMARRLNGFRRAGQSSGLGGGPLPQLPAKTVSPDLAQLQAEIATLRGEVARLRKLVTPPKQER